ncbi:MAG: M42 family metallopeptidase [Candidatus Hadarchaeales archaeon]
MSGIGELLERLSNAVGVSGREEEVAELVKAELQPFVDEIRRDTMGNLIGIKRGSEPSCMLAAHMDEIGLMVKHIDERGFIRFVPLGGWFDQSLLNERVVFKTKKGPVYGVIGSKPPHLLEEEERKKPVKIENMFIDIGAKSEAEVKEAGIRIGSVAALDRQVRILLNGRVTGKAFDNRAGLAVMIEALKNTKTTSTVYAVGTVQEEVGLKGARTSAFGLEPTVAIALDVSLPGDYPGMEKKDSALEMGKGPSITVTDASGRGIIVSEKVLHWLTETAEKYGIPYQLDVAKGGTTDATAISLTKAGIPTGVISVPTRYLHSGVETLDLSDLKYASELVARALETARDYF